MVALASTAAVAARSAPRTLITTHLEMTSRAMFRPAYLSGDHFSISLMKSADVDFYRFLYRAVGENWCWRDRMMLSDEQLHVMLANPCVTVDVLYVGGNPAGYVELDHGRPDTEIAYFGLRPAYFGLGLGKHLLSHGIARAWEGGAGRVWVHTCNLDGPHALDNYLKRGFRVFRTEEEPMPERYL
jgi:GNAT superfamily N-acetyltransferase